MTRAGSGLTKPDIAAIFASIVAGGTVDCARARAGRSRYLKPRKLMVQILPPRGATFPIDEKQIYTLGGRQGMNEYENWRAWRVLTTGCLRFNRGNASVIANGLVLTWINRKEARQERHEKVMSMRLGVTAKCPHSFRVIRL